MHQTKQNCSVFTREDKTNIRDLGPSPHQVISPIRVRVAGVRKLLTDLDSRKTACYSQSDLALHRALWISCHPVTLWPNPRALWSHCEGKSWSMVKCVRLAVGILILVRQLIGHSVSAYRQVGRNHLYPNFRASFLKFSRLRCLSQTCFCFWKLPSKWYFSQSFKAIQFLIVFKTFKTIFTKSKMSIFNVNIRRYAPIS